MVANFADVPATIDITIPDHAFDYLNLLEKAYKAVDLLSGTQVSLVLIRDQQVSIALPPRGAVVYKF